MKEIIIEEKPEVIALHLEIVETMFNIYYQFIL